MNNLFFINKIRIAATLCAGCIFFISCENDINEVQNLSKKTIAVEEGVNIESFMSQAGKMKARLTAPIMHRYQTDSPYVEFPKSLHVDFYNDTLGIDSRLDARYGKYRESENKVLLRDSVIIYSISGDTLWCQELWWNQQTEKFYTDKPVRIHKKDKTVINGQHGLEAAQNFSWYVIYNNTGQASVPKNSVEP
jgi:LPS export ABC transporter protein LptC